MASGSMVDSNGSTSSSSWSEVYGGPAKIAKKVNEMRNAHDNFLAVDFGGFYFKVCKEKGMEKKDRLVLPQKSETLARTVSRAWRDATTRGSSSQSFSPTRLGKSSHL